MDKFLSSAFQLYSIWALKALTGIEHVCTYPFTLVLSVHHSHTFILLHLYSHLQRTGWWTLNLGRSCCEAAFQIFTGITLVTKFEIIKVFPLTNIGSVNTWWVKGLKKMANEAFAFPQVLDIYFRYLNMTLSKFRKRHGRRSEEDVSYCHGPVFC